MERSYIAFISYKHTERDAAIAKRVHTLIENYVIPKTLRKDSKKLGIVFRDEEELPISSDLTESIRTALDASRFLIVICSPEAKESPWVAREIHYFLQHHDARDAFVVLANGEPNDVFPHPLTHILNKTTGEYEEIEPLALDVRAGTIGDSLKKVKSLIKKLYAAMLGCSYDSLVQREKTRRMKRLATLVTLCVLVASCFIGVLFVKNRELSQKNDQLTAAIELTLQRESQLLAEDADEALQNGEIAAAMRYASDALLSEDIPRPYHAPAERVLFSAIDVLGTQPGKTLLSKVALEHRAPIEMLSYSTDGSFIYTIDLYGTVSCFDASTGNSAWSMGIAEELDSVRFETHPQIWYDSEYNIIICHYSSVIAGLDASAGTVLWRHKYDATMRNGLFFNAERHEIAYIGHDYIFDPENSSSYNENNFINLSALNGDVVHKITILKTAASEFAEFPAQTNFRSCGTFSGSDRFTGVIIDPTNNSSEWMLYNIDLADGALSYAEEKFPVKLGERIGHMQTFYMGEDKILMVCGSGGLDMRYFDIASGKVLWEATAETQPDYISAQNNCFVVPLETSFIIGASKYIALIDKASGEVTSSSQLLNVLIDMYPLQDGFFAFSLANGYCAVGWKNSYGLHDSNSYDTIVDLPDTPMAVAHNGGPVHVTYLDDKPTGFNIPSRQDGGGSISYLSGDRCTAYVTTVLPNPDLPEPIILESKDAGAANPDGNFMDANRQASTGNIVSARCDWEHATVWIDGQDETIIPLPEDVTFAVVNGLIIRSMFHVGENGLLVLSDFVSEESIALDNFAIYNLASKEWKMIEDIAHGAYNRPITFGQKSPVFAVYDEDMNIRIYDWNTGKPIHCIHAELPLISVKKFGMMMDDQYIYVVTEDGQFIIYSVAAGEVAFRAIVSRDFSPDAFSTWLDQTNHRLYTGVNGEALCIDVRTWEQLIHYSDTDQFKFYSAAQNEVYISSYDTNTSTTTLRAIPIPTTDELIDIALDVLN